MTKGEETREMILEQASQLFSRRGYAGASLSTIMEATGLEKGGIYNHFKNKDQLALEAFDYAFGVLVKRFDASLEGVYTAPERLLALVYAFGGLVSDPFFRGGCPVLNTAVDSDDTHPALMLRARGAMDKWYGLVGEIVTEGLNTGQLGSSADASMVATVLIGSLEGAVMLTKLYHDGSYMQRTVEHLAQYIKTLQGS